MARRTSIKSGNRVEIEARRIDGRNWPSSTTLSPCAVDPLSTASLLFSWPVVNLFQDILDHCTPHYVFVYVRGGSSADNFPFPLCHFCVPRALKERRMADREGEEWPIVFPSRSKAERISDLSPSVQPRTGNLDFKRPSFESSSLLPINDRPLSISNSFQSRLWL